MSTPIPAVNPTITGAGMKRITVPMRAIPMSTSIAPAINVAVSSPEMP